MKRSLLLLVIILLLVPATPARADAAPPAPPPGANLGPGDELTQVRMVSETVMLVVWSNAPSGGLGQAGVTADFTMRNMGTQTESMAARFPISASDGYGNLPEIRDLGVRVNGSVVPTRRTLGPEIRWGDELVPWAEFDVTFPPGEDVDIRVVYTLDAYGEAPYASFEYIFETGAGWYGTIGRAELILRLPYEASVQNVLLGPGIGVGQTTAGGVIAGNDVRWEFTDFEPTGADNLQAVLVMPGAWLRVLTERENVARSPNDGEAWGRLGRACKEITLGLRGRGVREDEGARELYRLSVEAYGRALTLLPQDALWHAGFADLLAYHAHFGALAWLTGTRGGADAGRTLEQIQADAGRALQEIRTAQSLAPQDPTVAEIANEIRWLFPDADAWTGGPYTGDLAYYGPMVPMPTPSLAATTAPTSPVPAPATTEPSVTAISPTPEAQPASGGGLPCGAGAVALLPVALTLATRNWRPGGAARSTSSAARPCSTELTGRRTVSGWCSRRTPAPGRMCISSHPMGAP
jgi:hypothetical protein